MDRRLIQAYDKMTMPDGCSQRIEAVLMEKSKPLKEQKYTMVLRQTSSRWAWVRAAALVCLAVALAVGSVALFIGNQGTFAAKPSEIPVFTQPTVQTTVPDSTEEDSRIDYFPYGNEGEEFLEKMCCVMPQWDGYASLDDVFWTEFIVRLLNDFVYPVAPENISGLFGSRVTTAAGDALLIDGSVQMEWETLNVFVQEAMGCELPEFNPNGEYLDRISYVNGVYTVQVTEFSKLSYVRRICDGSQPSKVIYDIFQSGSEDDMGQVSFYLEEARNERGFIITGRPTDLRMEEAEGSDEAEAVALTFTEACFSEDVDAMREHLSSREDSSLILNPYVNEAYNNGGEAETYKIFGVRFFATEEGAENLVAYVDYAVQSSLYPGWSLVLNMVQTEEGWKVRNWTYKNPEGYDPDREEIYDTALSIADFYVQGNARMMKHYMTSDRWNPPVYEGEKGYEGETWYPRLQKIQVYFDFPGETNDLGEPMADAWVELQEAEDALNSINLYLHFVKTDDGWKVDKIGEG